VASPSHFTPTSNDSLYVSPNHSLISPATTTLTNPGFTISASSPTPVHVGQLETSIITIADLNGFAGNVAVTDEAPPGLACGPIVPDSVAGTGTAIVSCSASNAEAYVLAINGTSGSLVNSTTATFSFVDFMISASSPSGDIGYPATSTITVTYLNGFNGIVTLTDNVPSGDTCDPISQAHFTQSGTTTLSCDSGSATTFPVIITSSSSSLSHYATATFTFIAEPDFELTATSPVVSDAGQPATSTINVTPLNGFTGTVVLTDNASVGLTCQAISPSTIRGSGIAVVSCNATDAATYLLTVIGTNGALEHTKTATFSFKDFAVAASNPGAVGVGSFVKSTITTTEQNGFEGRVVLTDTLPSGLTCQAIAPATMTGSGSASVSCEANTVGSYTLIINATSDLLSHSTGATFTYVTPDFMLTTGVSSLNIDSGGSGTAMVSITLPYDFGTSVTLTVAAPSGISCDLNPTMIQSSSTSTLTCSGNAAGDYPVTVTATGGRKTHTANLIVHVATLSPAAPAPATILELPPAVFSSIIGVIIIAIIVGATLLLRRPKRANP
jgi:hypothetical protein